MNNLIPITGAYINGAEVNSVNARELHEFLGSKQEFANWIKKRLDDTQADENVDYVSLDKVIKRENGATTRKEYHLTLDLAKEIAMLEKNEKGKQARKYFIEAEKRYWQLRQSVEAMVPKTLPEALRLAAEQAEQVAKLQAQIKADESYTNFGKIIEFCDDSILVSDFAKMLFDKHGIKIGRDRCWSLLRELKYIMPNSTEPYQKWLEAGYFERKPRLINTPKGTKEVFTTKITGKGQIALAKKIIEYFQTQKAS